MRWLRRCWHVTSRTFHDDDVYHDDGYDDDDDVDGGGAINLVDNWTGV